MLTLLTSFQPWLPHHRSNASDDLLQLLSAHALPEKDCIYLRHLPVELESAWQLTQHTLQTQQPEVVILCGMAEKRSRLTVESQARGAGKSLQTPLNLDQLCHNLEFTEISHDAGKFVCEALYFKVLDYLDQDHLFSYQCLFVHVPLLTPDNQDIIVQDFLAILHQLPQTEGS